MANRERTAAFELPQFGGEIEFDLNRVSLDLRVSKPDIEVPTLWVPLGGGIRYADRKNRNKEITLADSSRSSLSDRRLATLDIPLEWLADLRVLNVWGSADCVHFEGKRGETFGHKGLDVMAQAAAATGFIACTGGVQMRSLHMYSEAAVLHGANVRNLAGAVDRISVDSSSNIVDGSELLVRTDEPIKPLRLNHHPDSPL